MPKNAQIGLNNIVFGLYDGGGVSLICAFDVMIAKETTKMKS